MIKYVYYVKEDLEKNRPLVKDMSNIKSMKDIVNTEKSFIGTTSGCSF